MVHRADDGRSGCGSGRLILVPTGAAIRRHIEALAAITASPPGLTRMVWTPEHRRANDLVAEWMRAAGLSVREDAAGNILGRIGGEGPPLLLGSHLDSVRDAGSWDGPLGVVTAIAAIRALLEAGWTARRPVEVVGFCDEEGTRFGAAMLGSRALAGHFDPAALALRDEAGVTMADAMRAFGLDPARIGEAACHELRAYLELHIEQGPVLERLDLPVGCVTAIAGATRLAVDVTGEAGHAGTVPMPGRRDALAAASACVLAVEEAARAERGAVATVGRLEVAGAAVNTIPGHVTFSIDIRAPDDAQRVRLVRVIRADLARVAGTRRVAIDAHVTHELPATPCAAWLQERIALAIGAMGMPVQRLASGAGHDGMALRDHCDIGMLFVRCAGGISHNPAESAADADIALGARVLMHLIEDLA